MAICSHALQSALDSKQGQAQPPQRVGFRSACRLANRHSQNAQDAPAFHGEAALNQFSYSPS